MKGAFTMAKTKIGRNVVAIGLVFVILFSMVGNSVALAVSIPDNWEKDKDNISAALDA